MPPSSPPPAPPFPGLMDVDPGLLEQLVYDVVEITAEELMPCTHPVSETIAVNTSLCPRCGKLTQAPLPLSRGERATFMATVARRSAEGWKETPVRIKSVVRYEATVRDLEAQLAARDTALEEGRLLLERVRGAVSFPLSEYRRADLLGRVDTWLTAHSHKGDPDAD